MKMSVKMIPLSRLTSRQNPRFVHCEKALRCLPFATSLGQRAFPSMQVDVVNGEKPGSDHGSSLPAMYELNSIRGMSRYMMWKGRVLFYSDRYEKGTSFSTATIPNPDGETEKEEEEEEAEEEEEGSVSASLLNNQMSTGMDEKSNHIKANKVDDFVIVDKDDLIQVNEDNDTQIIDTGCQTVAVIQEEDSSEEDGRDDDADFYDYIQSEDDIDELLSVLLGLEKYFPDEDPKICHTCLRLAELCYQKGENPEKIVDYARKAYHNFDASKEPMRSAKSLLMMGIGQYRMGELKEAMIPLGKAGMMLEAVEVPLAKEEEIATLQYSINVVLGEVKIALGWLHEAALDFKNGLKAIERILSPDDSRLGTYYMQTADAYLKAKNPKEALSLCLRLIPIYTSVYGSSSSEVADARSLLLQIYYELNDYENAVSECEEVSRVLEDLGRNEEAFGLTLESMQALFHLRKFKEAVVKLKDIIGKIEKESPLHVETLILLARAYAGLKEEKASVECCMNALTILEGNKFSFESAKSLVRLAIAYEQLQNCDQAILILHKALEILGQLGDDAEASSVLADVEGHLGYLFLWNGKPYEALPHLERSVARKKDLDGQESLEILNMWNYLGVAYAHVHRLDDALSAFKSAMLLIRNGCRDHDSLSVYICSNLSLTCKMIGRIDEAIEHKQALIDVMKKNNASAFDLKEAEKEFETLLLMNPSNGGIDSETSEQILGKMLRTCTGTWTGN